MTRRRLVQFLSLALPAVLAAAVVMASVRVTARTREAASQPEVAQLKKTPYELRFLTEDPNANPFNVTPGGPGAPPLPTLPSDATTPKASAPAPNSLTAAHRNATQTPGDPASFHWALIIGINDYAGSTRDNIGSYQDAVALRAQLLELGWRNDHVVLLANRAATKPNIMEGLRWLASKTDEQSTAIFHYSGHEKPFRNNADRDTERRDVGLWVSDNGLIADGVLGDALGGVRAKRMWINLAVCRAGGFNDAGTLRAGRVVTFSSPEEELSYEDPDVRYSVFGYNMIVKGMRQRKADLNGNGVVTVEEAFFYSVPLVVERTEGNQHPMIDDRYPGEFQLSIQAV